MSTERDIDDEAFRRSPEGRRLANELLGEDAKGGFARHIQAIDHLLQNLPILVEAAGATPDVTDALRSRLQTIRSDLRRLNPDTWFRPASATEE